MEPTEAEVSAAMAVRDLMSATMSLSELPSSLIDDEFDDIELAYKRLGAVLLKARRSPCYSIPGPR